LRYSLDEALKKYTRKTQASTIEVLWSKIQRWWWIKWSYSDHKG
jgi:hypothetical protein